MYHLIPLCGDENLNGMAKRGLVRTIFKRLGIILINAFETIGGLLKLLDLTLRQFAWLLFVTGLGLLLLWMRETFFDIAPSIASQADAWTVGINTLIVAVDAMMITIEAITSILASIISGQPQFDAIPTVSAKGVQEFCETVPPACAPINSAALVLDILIRPAASPAVCPTVRYMYPTWVYDIFWPVVDAFALSYEATPSPGNNCQCNEHCTHQIACVVRFFRRHQWHSPPPLTSFLSFHSFPSPLLSLSFKTGAVTGVFRNRVYRPPLLRTPTPSSIYSNTRCSEADTSFSRSCCPSCSLVYWRGPFSRHYSG